MPLGIGVIGMGGFAATHHDAVLKLEREGRCRLICTCDPSMNSFDDRAAELGLRERGVSLHEDYRKMLSRHAGELDLVTVPAPLPLHAEMHEACVRSGASVYLEKPPTLDYEELERMLVVERDARMSTMVGFNFIVESGRRDLKRRLLAGEFGRILHCSFMGLWPRPASYFKRTYWAGRLLLDGRTVLDSCFGNAMAHYLFNILFWCGRGEVLSWAVPTSVEAELYRAHEIEGADTAFIRAQTEDGIEIRLALSHACNGQHRDRERLVCEKACIDYLHEEGFRIEWADGSAEAVPNLRRADVYTNLSSYVDYLEGRTDRPLIRLEDCRGFISLCGLAYPAAGSIHTLPRSCLEGNTAAGDGDHYLGIRRIDEICREMTDCGRMPAEQRVPWAVAGKRATPVDLTDLSRVVREMADCRAWERQRP